MSDQQIQEQQNYERRMERVPQTQVETCAECRVEFELLPNTSRWYSVEEQRYCEHDPVWIRKHFLCSPRCQSQFVFECSNKVQQASMKALARAWEEVEQAQHPLNELFGAADLALAYAALRDLIEKLAGPEYLNGDENPPQWYEEAVKDIWDRK